MLWRGLSPRTTDALPRDRYWQASQSGSSKEQASGTAAGAGSAAAAALWLAPPPDDTALSVPEVTVDFSVVVADSARK